MHPRNNSASILFDQLRLPVQKRTGLTGEPVPIEESLEKLARLTNRYPQAKVALKIVEHRQISKLKGTYVDALPLLVKPKTGQLHTSFNQTVAATGRFELFGTKFAEYPDAYRTGKTNSASIRSARGLETLDCRLLAD